MNTFLRCLFALVGMLAAASPVRASFHLYTIDEIYSTPDGKVQFIPRKWGMRTGSSWRYDRASAEVRSADPIGPSRTRPSRRDRGGEDCVGRRPGVAHAVACRPSQSRTAAIWGIRTR